MRNRLELSILQSSLDIFWTYSFLQSSFLQSSRNFRAEGALTESAKNTVYLDLRVSETTDILTDVRVRKNVGLQSKTASRKTDQSNFRPV